MNGLATEYAHYVLGGLFAMRVLHVEFGLYGKGTLGYGRPIGYFVCDVPDLDIMGLWLRLLVSRGGSVNVRGMSCTDKHQIRPEES